MDTLNPQVKYKHKIIQGPSQGDEIELHNDTLIIGRESDTDIQINAPSVSRRHARLVKRPEGYWIEDIGSSNGTFINGKRIEDRISLNPGDQIRLGQSILIAYTAFQTTSAQTRVDSGAQQDEDAGITPAVQIPAIPPDVQSPVQPLNLRPPAPPVPPPEPPAPVVSPEAVPPPISPSQQPVTQRMDDPAATMLGEELDLDGGATAPRLVITVAGESPQTYILDRDQYSIGRAEDNDIIIRSKITSRKHARLQRTSDGFQLIVLPEASNPVLHRGRPLNAPHQLMHGDTLRIGGLDPGMMGYVVHGGVDGFRISPGR